MTGRIANPEIQASGVLANAPIVIDLERTQDRKSSVPN